MASTNDGDDIFEIADTDNVTIKGLMLEYAWSVSARVNFQYTIPDEEEDYEDTRDLLVEDYPDGNHEGVVAMQQFLVDGVHAAIAHYNEILNFEITFNSDTNADTQLRYAVADISLDTDDEDNLPLAYAWHPEDDGLLTEQANWKSGDMFYNVNDFSTSDAPGQSLVGTKQYIALLHETGHALGLKHGHEDEDTDNPVLPAEWDTQEFTLMTYRSYVGAPTDGVVNEDGHYAQTLMMLDIQALQYLYGPDFTTREEDTTYRWDTIGAYQIDGVNQWTVGTGAIFLTIWDGGGVDTYDYSAFANAQQIDLAPGRWSMISQAQRARLGDDWATEAAQLARGNVFNALLYRGDSRSLIENVIAGAGADEILGNRADNRMEGGGSADTIHGEQGNDTLVGGVGADELFGDGGDDVAAYLNPAGETITLTPIGAPNQGRWTVTGAAGSAGDQLSGIEGFQFGNGSDSITVAAGDSAHLITADGAGGNDTITGSARDEIFIGGAGTDIVTPGAGRFHAYGGEQDAEGNWVENLADNDLLSIDRRGSDAFIFLHVSSGSLLGGFRSSDKSTAQGFARIEFFGSVFNDRVEGADGDDRLEGLAGRDRLESGIGRDTLEGGNGNDSLDGGEGNDVIIGGIGNDQIVGGDGADRIETGTGDDGFVHGGDGRDTITGSNDDEFLYGDLGNDRVTGLGGNDTLESGLGNDTLRGGAGNDVLNIGAGKHSIDGGANFDQIDVDRLNTTKGMSFVLNGSGSDGTRTRNVELLQYFGGSGNDTVTGGANADLLQGSAGNDLLTGGGDRDLITGDLGKDTLFGGAGGDDLLGGEENDRLDGGQGGDDLTGGDGSDVFVFTAGAGGDTISDFDTSPPGGQDRLDVSAFNFANFADMKASGVRITGNAFEAHIDFGAGRPDVTLFVGVATLSGTDFIF